MTPESAKPRIYSMLNIVIKHYVQRDSLCIIMYYIKFMDYNVKIVMYQLYISSKCGSFPLFITLLKK